MQTFPGTLDRHGASPPPLDLPLRYFVFGLTSLAIFGVALPLFAGDVLAQHHYTHRTIAFTHLLNLGWITSIILGAMIQLVPIALGTRLYSERLVRWAFWFHAIGVAGMVSSFWWWNLKFLLWFGSLVALGLGIFIYDLLRTLLKTSFRDLVAAHLISALAYLLLTLLAGEYLMHDKLTHFSPFGVIPSIHAHAHLATLGWFGLTMIGVSYRLIPMFILSAIQNPRRAWTAFVLLNLGIPGIFLGVLLQLNALPFFALLTGTGLGLWFWEMMAIFKARKRAELDPSLKQARIALFHLPILFILGLWLGWPDDHLSLIKSQAETSYALLALLGWVSLFIMGILAKIIPFLVWYRVYAPLVGRRSVPRLQDLYSVALQKWSLWLFMIGLWGTAGAVAFAASLPLFVIQIIASIMGLGILLFVVNMGIPMGQLLNLASRFRGNESELPRASPPGFALGEARARDFLAKASKKNEHEPFITNPSSATHGS